MQGVHVFSGIFDVLDRFIGLGDASPDFRSRAHAEQIRAVARLTPPIMLGNILAISAILLAFGASPVFSTLLAWAMILLTMVGLFLRSWMRFRALPPRTTASPRGIRRITLRSAVLGGMLGLLPIMTYIDASSSQRLLVAAVMTGMISVGSFALSALPRANLAFLIPATIGSALALAMSMQPADLVLGVLQCAFVTLAMLASLFHARMLVSHLRAEHDALEQQGVIGLLLKSFEDHASDWLWHLGADGRFRNVSLRFSHATSLRADRLERVDALALLRRGASQPAQANDLLDAFARRQAFRDFEIGLTIRGQARWWRISGEPVFGNGGTFIGYRGVGSDITETREAANRLTYLAHHDGLTGAVNRGKFAETLAGISVRKSIRGGSLGLIYVDLDYFKAVNDRYGHRTGDQLLGAVVRRIRGLLAPGDVLARLGGDEFAIAIEDPGSEDAVGVLADSIIACLSEPFEIGDKHLTIGASLGIVITDAPLAVDELLHRADLALYIAKEAGRRTWRLFRPDMEFQRREREVLEADLARAIDRNQLDLHYQPFVNSQGHIAGFEALVRWQHPERGMIPPGTFIPLAEKSPLINAIGSWVLREACRAAAAMPSYLVIAVNLSARQFEPGKLAAEIRQILDETGLAPNRLELEVTESVLIDNPDAVVQCLHELKALGIRIAMDDFGTGYSSLSYLWRFPFDKIKIDGSFISAMTQDRTARSIVQAIATLTRQMGVVLTAERVETTEEIEFLRQIRCDYLQGYFFARPLPLAEAAARLLAEPQRQLRAPRRRNQHIAA